jgi:hypothetical protein
LLMAKTVAPGSTINLMILVDAQFLLTIVAGIVCVALAAVSIFLQYRRIMVWIVGLLGVTVALASGPLGTFVLNYVMAKYRLTDGG